MEQSPSWEANWFCSYSRNSPHFWNPKVHHRTHKCPPPVPILSQLHPVLTTPSHFLRLGNNASPSAARCVWTQWGVARRSLACLDTVRCRQQLLGVSRHTQVSRAIAWCVSTQRGVAISYYVGHDKLVSRHLTVSRHNPVRESVDTSWCASASPSFAPAMKSHVN